MNRIGSMPHSLTISERNRASRFCSTQQHELVLRDEIRHVLVEHEGADAQHVEAVAAVLENGDRLVHGGAVEP